MSNKSVFQPPKLKAQKSSRNSFDLGYKHAFNVSLGEIVPCCVLDVPAGSYVELGEENQTYNFNPLVRPTFTRLKEHIDYFAVPKVQLWSLYDNFITGQSQYMSSALGSSFLAGSNNQEEVPQQVPMFDGHFLTEALANMYSTSNPFGLSELHGTLKLLNYLGYGNFYGYLKSPGDVQDVYSQCSAFFENQYLPQNFFALLAYQKVYFSYFRNSRYERNVPTAYNMDWLPKTKLNLTGTDYNANDFADIFKLRHRWLNKDYFMCVSPSILPLPSDIGFTGLSQYLAASTDAWHVFSLPGMPGMAGGQSGVISHSLVNGASNFQGVAVNQQNASATQGINNVSALRFAFAYDKLLRRMRSAGATFDSQMLAQFGIKPVDFRHGDAYYLGGYTNRLNVSEVVDTSSADINSLGQFGANISKYSVNKRKISYHAKEDCIIIGMYSTSYDVDYASSRYNRMNLKRFRFDFYNPAFENLGKQALYSGELTMIDDQTNPLNFDNTAVTTAGTATGLIGYIPRYLEYKTKIDTISGILDYANNNASAMPWTTQYRMLHYNSSGNLETRTQEPLSMPLMLVNPIILDDIVTTNYSTAWENDHFLINMYNDCKMVANMSIDGEIY